MILGPAASLAMGGAVPLLAILPETGPPGHGAKRTSQLLVAPPELGFSPTPRSPERKSTLVSILLRAIIRGNLGHRTIQRP